MRFSIFSNKDQENLLKLKKEYEDKGEEIVNIVQDLYNKRKEALSMIQFVYMYISSLDNCPRSIVDIIEEAYNCTKQFRQAIDWENEGNDIKAVQTANSGSAATAAAIGGVATGTAIATMGPSVAMAIATTFGTASTGVAISSIGGIAATNAALAWLGGGAIAAGGGGMAAGSALLALAGPIGWSVAATAAISAGIISSSRNKKYRELSEQISNNLKILEPKEKKLIDMCNNTSELISSVSNIKNIMSYTDFDEDVFPRNELFHIVTQTNTLAKSLNETVSMQN